MAGSCKQEFKRMGIMTTVLYNTTCRVCETIRSGFVKFAMGIWAFGESAGRARAAAELHRQGYTEEAKALMLSDN